MMLLYLENDKRNYFSFFQAIALNLTNNLSFEEFFKKYTNSNLTLELLINKLNDDNCKYKLLKNFLDYLIRNKYYLNLNFIKYFLNLDDCLSFYKFDSIFKDFALKHISKKEDKQEFSHEFIHFSFINYMIPFSPKNGIFHYQYKGVSLDVDEKITNLILYYISKNYIYKCDYTFNGLLKKFIEIGLLVDFTYFSYDYRKDNGNDSLYRAIFISDYIHRVKEEVKKTKDKQKKLGVMPNSQF